MSKKMKEFKASNGQVVRKHASSGNIEVFGYSGTLQHTLAPTTVQQTLREFFLHEARENGEIPFMHEGHIVVPRPSEDDHYGRCVTVVWEDGETVSTWEPITINPAAKAWFDAHPVEPPAPAWHSAQPGEVWDVTFEACSLRCLVFDDGKARFVTASGESRPIDSDDIVDATRVLEALKEEVQS